MYNKGKPLKSNTVSCLKIQPPSLRDYSSHYGAGKSGGKRKRKEVIALCLPPLTSNSHFLNVLWSVFPSPWACRLCVCGVLCCCCSGFGVGPQWLKTDALFFCSCLAGKSNGQSRTQDSESINEIYCDTTKWAREAISTRHIPVI